MISCSEAVKQLWEYMDGSVGAADHNAIEHHLTFCRRCCGELEFARELRTVLVHTAEEDVPDEVMERLNATLEEVDRA